jgi:hypothetical protein
MGSALLDLPQKIVLAPRPQRRDFAEATSTEAMEHPAVQPDSASSIQAEIDRVGVARLQSGIYFLDRSLRIGNPRRFEGIIGTGEARVYLVPKGDFPAVAGRGDIDSARAAGLDVEHLVLEGFTVFGGTHGLLLSKDPGNVGAFGTVAFSTFAHLRFVRQSIAAVECRNINGFDSNFWFQVSFEGVPAALLGSGQGTGAGMGYADKQHFLECQFSDISGTAWDWSTDRASGGEIWTDCYFTRVGSLTRTRAANNLFWLNCVMEDVDGPVGIHVTDHGTTATYYFVQVGCLWKGRGPKVVTDTQSGEVGTLFINTEFAQSSGSLVSNASHQVINSWNSIISGSVQLGNIWQGIFIASHLGRIDRPIEVIRGGTARTLL